MFFDFLPLEVLHWECHPDRVATDILVVPMMQSAVTYDELTGKPMGIEFFWDYCSRSATEVVISAAYRHEVTLAAPADLLPADVDDLISWSYIKFWEDLTRRLLSEGVVVGRPEFRTTNQQICDVFGCP